MMIDVTTNKPLRVLTDSTVGPYIEVAVDQLDEVQRLLEKHRVGHSVEEDVLSLNDGPFFAVIDLGREADAHAIQAILDSFN
jgi:hypothetical protein